MVFHKSGREEGERGRGGWLLFLSFLSMGVASILRLRYIRRREGKMSKKCWKKIGALFFPHDVVEIWAAVLEIHAQTTFFNTERFDTALAPQTEARYVKKVDKIHEKEML